MINKECRMEVHVDSPTFIYVGVCMGCGKERHLNTFRFCEECWITHSHIRQAEVVSEGGALW